MEIEIGDDVGLVPAGDRGCIGVHIEGLCYVLLKLGVERWMGDGEVVRVCRGPRGQL